MRQKHPTLWIDVSGAGLCLLLAVGLIWYSKGPMGKAARMDELKASIGQMHRDAAAAEAQVQEQRRVLESLRATLAQAERLPADAPIPQCQARLAELARASGVRITNFLPLPDREYPGIVERRFTFEARGTTKDVLTFLKGIESDEHWVDIGYLSLARPVGPDLDARGRTLAFAISMYSAAPGVAPPKPPGA
ncbi:MAG: hypothetical protein KJ057_09415 [Phycisphaerae bacterium]|nr:MAG: hypothetical protein EDS66_12440 [Planctomycetota bacterium]KAB2949939.1 MAG: hypothetical protein F9K17_01175 [Phycisphaerae bacterium]MBE7458568.1 hypothetical protein [Planctomycetia bacterium]MCK6465025.1 hypothetical protein [Phycisphaerae bacterium]MCL4718677.1 hypothetical protein [Phycisphaerae bacterium]